MRLPPALATFSFLVLLLLPRAPAPRAEAPPPRVVEHDLHVRLEPAQHRLVAEDRITVEAAEAGTLVLEHSRDLRSVGFPEYPNVDGKPTNAGGTEHGFSIAVPKGRSVVTYRYAGEVFDQVKKADDLSWVVGDSTKGVIFEKGVYLSGASRWVPTPPDGGVALFHVTSYVPAPFFVVTQGGVPERSETTATPDFRDTDEVVPRMTESMSAATTYRVAKARAVIPTDSLDLVAGPYVERSRTVEGVRLGAWFYESEAEVADLWLQNAEETVKRYVPLLGPYPHPKFDVVENFFASGYGMPSFTLLGQTVIQYVTAKAKREGGRIPPGYFDHEYVHGWYGNGLFVDYETGNWCEAATTYYSNYLAKELESPEKGRAERRATLEKFSIRVKPGEDYPLRRFLGKTEDFENDIGYGKGSMVFHLARRLLGRAWADKKFFDAVRAFTQANVGRIVSWDDWIRAFSEAAGRDLGPVLRPYLERTGLPEVELVEVARVPEGWRVHARQRPATDGGGPWPVSVLLRAEYGPGPDDPADTQMNVEDPIDLSSGEATVVLPADRPLRAVSLDPDYDLPRRIPDADLPPCLNRTLGAGNGVVVWRGSESLKALAEQIASQKGFRVAEDGFDPETFAGPVVTLETVSGRTGVEVRGKHYDDPSISVLFSTAKDGRLRTRYLALSEAAAARARYVTYYGWDPYVVFKNGVPIERDPRTNEVPSTRKVLAAAPAAGGPSDAAGRIRADVERLASSEFEGRRPGTEGHDACARWLRAQIDSPYWMHTREFDVGVPELLSPRRITILTGPAMNTFDEAFRPLPAGSGRFQSSPDSKLAVVDWESGADAIQAAAKAPGVKGLVLALPEPTPPELVPWLDTPAHLTPESEAVLAKPGRDGKPRPRPPLGPWISGHRVRVGWPAGVPRDIPVVTVERDFADETLRKFLGLGGAVEFEVSFGETARGRNVCAALPASGPNRGHVVLSAHFDAQGRDEGGTYLGADDNASGVACLLEVLRGLRAEWDARKDRKVELLVCFFDAEEWGLLGSRHFVENRGDLDVRAAINVDAIGRAVSKPTHLVGLGTHPDLAAVVRKRLEEQGLTIGKDVDKYAYEHGSDHWPFHEAGIPAVTVWATDYAVMNTTADTPDKVEPEGVAKIAAALRKLVLEDLDALAD